MALSSMETVSPNDGRYGGVLASNGTKWYGLTDKEAEERAKSSLDNGKQFAGTCEPHNPNQWNKHYVVGKSTQQVHKGVLSGSCGDFKRRIEDDLQRDDNQHPDVLRKKLERAEEDRARKELSDIRQSSFQEAAQPNADPVAIPEAASKCYSDPADKFFQRVYRVPVSDLKEYALLDARFDDKHNSSQTDQDIIDNLKSIDPFKWGSDKGRSDPITMWISSDHDNRFMMAVIEAGRHRAAAAMQASKDYVPVKFDCRFGRELTGDSKLRSASDLRQKTANMYPNNMLPLSCEGKYPVRAGSRC